MRKSLIPLVIPFLLAACGSVNSSIGAGFSAQAGLSRARIDVTIVRVYDQKTGGFKYYDSVFTLTQPAVTFTMPAGTVGGRVTSAAVTISDSSGNRYGDIDGQYTQSFNARLIQGYACTSTSGTPVVDSDPDSCAAANRVAITRQQTFPEANNNSAVQLLIPRIAEVALQDCQEGPCPANLSMAVTFTVVDDLNRTQAVTTSRIPIPVYRVSDTRREE